MEQLFDFFRDTFGIPPEIVELIVSYCSCDKCKRPAKLIRRQINVECKDCQNRRKACSKCLGKKKSQWCADCLSVCDDCVNQRIQYWCDQCYNKRCNVCRNKRNSCLCGVVSNLCAGCGPLYRQEAKENCIYDICVKDNSSTEHVIVRFIEKFHDQWCAEAFVERYMIKNLDALVDIKHRICGGYTPNRMYFRRAPTTSILSARYYLNKPKAYMTTYAAQSELPVMKVKFRWTHSPDAELVQIAGSFNGWNPEKMLWKDDVWIKKFPVVLRKEYQYKFIVDGEWMVDKKRPTIADSAGNVNNLLCKTIVPPHRSDWSEQAKKLWYNLEAALAAEDPKLVKGILAAGMHTIAFDDHRATPIFLQSHEVMLRLLVLLGDLSYTNLGVSNLVLELSDNSHRNPTIFNSHYAAKYTLVSDEFQEYLMARLVLTRNEYYKYKKALDQNRKSLCLLTTYKRVNDPDYILYEVCQG